MIKPMLAHHYAHKKVTFPCFVQPKLNGIRGIYVPGRHFQSRHGEIWHPKVVDHALSALTGLNLHLDGEFYCHGMSLQQINSRVSLVRNTPHEDVGQVKFYVFDILADIPFHKRHLVLRKLAERFKEHPSIGVVKTEEVTSEIEADYFYNKWKNVEGFEGMMYRDANAPYGFASRCGNKDNRWNYLLKRKEMIDLEATITDLIEMVSESGEPKGTLGSFGLMAPNGAYFTAGSGLTLEQRDKYWKAGIKMLGVKVKVNFEMLSDGGVPLKPIIDLVDYEA